MKPTTNKDVNAFVRTLVNTGWAYADEGKHVKLFPPGNGGFIIISKSPSDFRVVHKIKKTIRHYLRAGSL